MERKAEVLVLLVLSILTLCAIFLASWAFAGERGYKSWDEYQVEGMRDPFCHGQHGVVERQQLEEIEDSIDRIEQMNREIKDMERLQLWREIERRSRP